MLGALDGRALLTPNDVGALVRSLAPQALSGDWRAQLLLGVVLCFCSAPTHASGSGGEGGDTKEDVAVAAEGLGCLKVAAALTDEDAAGAAAAAAAAAASADGESAEAAPPLLGSPLAGLLFGLCC